MSRKTTSAQDRSLVDLPEVRAHLEPYYSEIGRPSIDPELMTRMLDRRLLLRRSPRAAAMRGGSTSIWLLSLVFAGRLGLDGEVPDRSTFSKN